MKRSIIAAIALTIALSAVSCTTGGEPAVTTDNTAVSDTVAMADTTAEVETTAETTAPVEASGTYICSLDNGVRVELGGDADALIASLGKPESYMEAPSCVHEGFDKVYTFDGYSITTSPDANGKQYVAELSLLSDVVAVDNILMIGCSASDVKKVLGNEYEEQFGVRKYSLPGATASIVMDGDIVSGIAFSAVK